MSESKSVFETLNAINVNSHTEKKNGLTYLSWAWAWAEVKKAYPNATYRIYENQMGLNYHTDGKTAWVKTGVTIEGIEYIEYLPIMEGNRKSMPLEKITSHDVNTAIQRSLTKACARHGLGLYIYAGEDLPEGEAEEPKKKEELDKKIVAQAAKYQIDLDRLAAYLKKTKDELTNEDLVNAISQKKERLDRNANADVQ